MGTEKKDGCWTKFYHHIIKKRERSDQVLDLKLSKRLKERLKKRLGLGKVMHLKYAIKNRKTNRSSQVVDIKRGIKGGSDRVWKLRKN